MEGENLIYIEKEHDSCHANNQLKGSQAKEESSNSFIARKNGHPRKQEELTGRREDKDVKRKLLNIRNLKKEF